MDRIYQLTSPRLYLRNWIEADLPAFAEMNADSEVMEFFPETLSSEESDKLARNFTLAIQRDGWGRWAVARQSDNVFIGFIGLKREPDMPCGECVEISWRLGRKYWGQGFAAEGAQATLAFAFSELGLPEVAAFTTIGNRRSRALMSRLGMIDTETNFPHPKLALSHPLSEHVYYKIDRETFTNQQIGKTS